MNRITKTIHFAPESLAKLLHLPEGIEVVSADRTEQGLIQVLIVDPSNKLPEEAILKDNVWVEAQNKGVRYVENP